jgi:hypothetical protein
MNLTDALIIPEYGDIEDARYRGVAELFIHRGIKPHFVPIQWRRSVMTQNVAQFADFYAKYDRRTLVVFGYGIGAMIAFVQSAVRPPAALILSSMAPWFAEDIPSRTPTHKVKHGSGRVGNYQKFTFADIAPKVPSKTFLLYSERESRRLPQVRTRTEQAHNEIAGSMLVVVPGDIQDFSGPDYAEALRRIISGL